MVLCYSYLVCDDSAALASGPDDESQSDRPTKRRRWRLAFTERQCAGRRFCSGAWGWAVSVLDLLSSVKERWASWGGNRDVLCNERSHNYCARQLGECKDASPAAQHMSCIDRTPARDTQRSRGFRRVVDRLARAPARGAEIAACAVAVLEVGRVDESLLPVEQRPPPGPAARWWSGRAGSRHSRRLRVGGRSSRRYSR